MYSPLLSLVGITLAFCQLVLAASRTSPPSGALVVRAGTTKSGEYKTLTAAIKALPKDTSSRSIFIYPGTYKEQVLIDRPGPLVIYGYTADTSSFTGNQVNIQAGSSSAIAGSNDASGTLRIHKNDFKLYNVNVKNTCGKACGQALALSQYGVRTSFYGVGFYGYQDTILVNQGTQVFLRCFIQGATDFIFGGGAAYFNKNTISIVGPGWVTASGRSTNDATMYVFENTNIVLGPGAQSDTAGKVYLGRPWRNFARVIFKNTVINLPFNKDIWSTWNSGTDLANVFYADYNTSGSGVSGAKRPSWVKTLSASQAAKYTISSAVGSDYTKWVDSAYLK